MKILACYPELISRGGAERTLAVLTKAFDIDIVTNKYSPNKTYKEFKNVNIIQLKQKNKALFGLKVAKTKFTGYDIYQSNGYFITNTLALKNSPCIWYCLAPKRDIYKPLREYYIKKERSAIKRLLKVLNGPPLVSVDKFLVNHVDCIVTISKLIQKRIKSVYGRKAEIVFPPVSIKEYKFKPPKDFYLYPGRLADVKRIDLAIKAFNKMPEKKLIVAGSIADKQYFKYLKGIAKKNIKFETNIPQKRLIDLYSTCIATICIPVLEDFGLVPVESMASGKPCIGANEGGLKETIIHKKTGFLIKPSVENIIKHVNLLDKKRAIKMKKNCLKRSKLFSEENYIKGMKKMYHKLMDSQI